MNVLNLIETHRYAATEPQVEALAHHRWSAGIQTLSIDGTYLRVLIAACQRKLGPKGRKRPAIAAQLQAVEEINAKFYAAVLRGITTADVAPDPSAPADEQSRRSVERNRRSTFARTAKATLVAFVNAGGDIRGLDVRTATKSALRAYTAGKTPADAKAGEAIAKAQDTVLRLIREEAGTNPDAAREHLGVMLEALMTQLETLPAIAAQVATMQPARFRATQVSAGAAAALNALHPAVAAA